MIQSNAPLDAGNKSMTFVAAGYLHQAWEQSFDGMRIVDENGIILHVNESYCRMIGKPRQEMEGQPFTTVYAERLQGEILARMQRAFLTRSIEPQMEGKYELWDGVMIWLEITHSFLSRDNQPPVLLSIFRDVTGRKRSEEDLKASRELHALVIEATDDGIWDWNLNTNEIFFSQRWKTMLGFEPDELENRYEVWLNLLHPDDREETVSKLRESCHPGHPDFRFEFRMRSKEGSYRWIQGNGRTLFDETGTAIRMVGSQADITERKYADVVLRESEEKFRQMAENIQSALWITEVGQGPVIYVNPAFEEVFGIPCKVLYAKPRIWMDAIHAADHERVAMSITQVIRQKMPSASEEFRITQRDGSIRWISARTFPIRNEAGRVYRLAGIAEDITERKRMEGTLRESEERYRLLIQLSPDAIYIQSDGKIVFVNDAGLALFGASRADQLIGLPVVDLIHPDYRKIALDQFQRLRSTKARQPRVEEKYLRLNGSPFDVEVIAAPFTFQNQPMVQVVARDITERRQAEEKIREQAEFLDKANDAIIVKDLQGQIIYWNRGGETLYGWMREEALGKNLAQLLEPSDSIQLAEVLKKTQENGSWKGELKQVTKAGETKIVQSSCTLLRDSASVPKSILMIHSDVTENKMLESQLLRSQRLESLGTLAGGVAHDLNNVLTPILMSVSMLKSSARDPQEVRILNSVESAARRGAEIIKQLLTFARGVKGEHVLIQLKHLIRELDSILKSTFPKSIDMIVDVGKNIWTVHGDATQLHQVMLNLCVNARDAMPDGGKLTIKVENASLDDQYARMHIDAKPGRYVLITVQDTGFGIPPGIIDKIFDPFFTTKEVGKGTGLGLSTVMTIVKNHGGFLNVYSEVNRGSVFKVYIPATAGTERLEPQPVSESPRGHGELILVVEDEAAVRDVIVHSLETNGYRVTSAKDGAEALALYAQMMREVAAVITDIMMPILDGPATIRALRKMNPDVKIIAISGLTAEAKVQEVTSLGVGHFLSKPFTTEKLLITLHAVVAGSPTAPEPQ